MTEAPQGGRPVADDGSEPPVVRDKRRIDPQTGQLREPSAAQGEQPEQAQGQEAPGDQSHEASEPQAQQGDLAAERLADLQRLQAEYVNYRKRVERDRDVARDQAVASVLESLLPVMDDLHLARQHGDLESGPFVKIADKLEQVLSRAGLTRFGEVGEAFDPSLHDALMHVQAELAPGTQGTTVVQVLQPGYRAGERVLRAARVAVADPSDDAPAETDGGSGAGADGQQH